MQCMTAQEADASDALQQCPIPPAIAFYPSRSIYEEIHMDLLLI